MTSFKDLQANHRLFLFIYTIIAISVITVFRHGTTLLYLILWVYLFMMQKQPLKTLRISIEFALKPPFVFLSLLMLWGVLTTIWSIHPKETLIQSTANLLIFASFAIFFAVLIKQDIVSSKSMVICMMIIFVVSLTLLLLQAVSNQKIRYFLQHVYRGLKPNTEVLAILALPLIAQLIYQKRYGWAVLFYIATLMLTYIVQIRTSFIALVVGCVIAICYYLFPRLLIWVTTIVSVIYTLALPWLEPLKNQINILMNVSIVPKSFVHRLLIWRFVTDNIKDKIWLGWGVNASHHFPGGTEKVSESTKMTLLPSHPHNEVLQIWLELGLIGAVLLACFHGALFWQLRKEPNRLIISMYGFYLTSIFIMLQMSHSTWHKWWITWIALCGGLLMAFSKNVSRETMRSI
jgi:O-antigen ligase